MSSDAIRRAKAWRVRVTWSDDADIVYAASAGKARYELKLRLGDCYPDLQFKQIAASRAKDCDRYLPTPHRLVAELSEQERGIILHAFGATYRRPEVGYRNHYCTAPGDLTLLRLTFELGLFRGPYGEQAYGQSPGWIGAFFYLTELGKHVALSMTPTYP
jgi:hypothetical protein